MKIAFIGSGKVGAPLADHLQRLGHEVTFAARGESATLQKALARNPALRHAPSAEAVTEAEVVFLATPFHVHEAALAPLTRELRGKILVDCTNPVAAGMKHGLGSTHSGSEAIQKLVPGAKVVKAFNIYGFENFENSAFPGHSVRPGMMFCGDDAAAKKTVGHLIEQLGWEPVDVGGLVQALHLEHMTLLWVRMVRMGGHSPHMVWAVLRR